MTITVRSGGGLTVRIDGKMSYGMLTAKQPPGMKETKDHGVIGRVGDTVKTATKMKTQGNFHVSSLIATAKGTFSVKTVYHRTTSAVYGIVGETSHGIDRVQGLLKELGNVHTITIGHLVEQGRLLQFLKKATQTAMLTPKSRGAWPFPPLPSQGQRMTESAPHPQLPTPTP